MKEDTVKISTLHPDDIIVLKTEHKLSEAEFNRMKDRIQKFFPEHKVVVLDSAASIEIIRTTKVVKRKSKLK